MTLSDFLLARIAEDEAMAREAATDERGEKWHVRAADYEGIAIFGEYEPADYGYEVPATRHIAHHDPARVLAECEAKRRIVAGAGDDWTTRLLAAVYADHPDYREEWRS